MTKELANALRENAESLGNVTGNKAMIPCYHQFLVFLGWEYDLETADEIMDKAVSMILKKDWGLSRSQWNKMGEITARFGF